MISTVTKFLLPSVLLLVSSAGWSAAPPESTYDGGQWRQIGPFRGGRAVAVAGVPGSPNVFYFGAAAGGVWKTIDAGASWKPIFDAEKVSSIGAIAVARSNPDIIYVGTGEANLRGNMTCGGGVFKSTDAGKTWTDLGLDRYPADRRDHRRSDRSQYRFGCRRLAMPSAPMRSAAFFARTDGGKTWNRVLYKDELTGAIDLASDPHNSKIVYAALWQVRRQPWNFSSGGPGSGLYRSMDGGLTWSQLNGNGLPDGILGRIDVSISGGRLASASTP